MADRRKQTAIELKDTYTVLPKVAREFIRATTKPASLKRKLMIMQLYRDHFEAQPVKEQ